MNVGYKHFPITARRSNWPQRLKRLRKWLRYSVVEMSEATWISPSVIAHYESKTFEPRYLRPGRIERFRRTALYLCLIRRQQREHERMLDTLWQYPSCRRVLVKHGFAQRDFED